MTCEKCKNEIEPDSVFCNFCGNRIEAAKDKTEDKLEIVIPKTFGGGTVVFTNDCIEYGSARIPYKDAVSISYHSINHSINFVPTSQSFSYSVASYSGTISFSFSTALYIGHKAKKDVWIKIIAISQKLIEPVIVKKLVDRIFTRGEVINIGGIEFSKDGYSRSKTFGGKEAVSWDETIYTPKFSSGNVVLWKEKDGKGRRFASISMANSNATILPELVLECYNRRPRVIAL